MKLVNKVRLLKVLLCLTLGGLLLFSGCRQESPPPAPPDPASLIEGVYLGSMDTQTPSDIYIFSAVGLVLLKQVAPATLELHSLIGYLTPHTIKVYAKGDTVFSQKDDPLDLTATFYKGKMTYFHIQKRNFRIFRPDAIDLSIYELNGGSNFKPLSLFKYTPSPPPGSIGARTAGFYNGVGKFLFNNQDALMGLLALKAISSDTVQILDRNGTFGPYKVGLHQLPGTDEWSGTSTDGTIGIRITVTADGPQQLQLLPLTKETGASLQLIDYTWQKGSFPSRVFVSSL